MREIFCWFRSICSGSVPEPVPNPERGSKNQVMVKLKCSGSVPRKKEKFLPGKRYSSEKYGIIKKDIMVEGDPSDRYQFLPCLDGIQKNLLVILLWIRIYFWH